LTVKLGRKEKPTDAEYAKLAEVLRIKVSEDLPIYVFTLPRAEAEAKYGKVMYNNHAVSKHRNRKRKLSL
jgi:alanyl-tRNA synthetase